MGEIKGKQDFISVETVVFASRSSQVLKSSHSEPV